MTTDITHTEAMATIRKAAAPFIELACDRCGGTGELVSVGNGRYIRLDQWNGDQGDLIDCPECKGEPMSAWEQCWRCHGYGEYMPADELITCPECKGFCQIRKRDKRGRFTR